MSRVALIAGEGTLPGVVASALGKAGRGWGAFHLEGHLPKQVGQSRGFRLEGIAGLLDRLREGGYDEVVFAGRVARPAIDPRLVDEASAPIVARLAEAMRLGDDGALRAVIAVFEETGLRVVSPADVVPALVDLPETGAPSEADLADLDRARAVHDALAAQDVGQAVVVASGQVLGVEALPGTDFLLATLGMRPGSGGTAPAPPVPRPPRPNAPLGHTVPARSAEAGRPVPRRSAPEAAPRGQGMLGGMVDWLSGSAAPSQTLPDFPRPEGGVLWKGPKAGQDLRVDMPAIGPDTVRAARRAGLNGVAVARGRVIVLEPETCAALAREGGLFLAALD